MSDTPDDPTNPRDEKPEEPEEPVSDPDDLTLRDIRELEKAANAEDVAAQRRLARSQGVETYEQYISPPKRAIILAGSVGASAGPILKALNDVYGPVMERTAGLLAGISETSVIPKLWDSLAQDSALKASSLLADELSKEAQDVFRLGSMPWAENVQKQIALIAQAEMPAFQHFAELAAERDAMLFGGERMRQLAESVGESFAANQQSLAERFGVSLSAMVDGPAQELAQSVSESLNGMKPSAVELAGDSLSGKDLLGAGTAPELRLDTPFLTYAYVSPQERVAHEIAENNRLQREILAEMREQTIGKKQKKRQWALVRPARGAAPKPDKPIAPKSGSTLDAWFDYYHAMKETGYKITFKTLEDMSGYAENTFKQAHARYKLERGSDVPDD